VKCNRIPLLLILSFAAVGAFIVPWYVPASQPSISISYRYGFNNSVAILTVGVSLVALFIRALFRRRAIAGDTMDQIIARTFDFETAGGGNSGLACAFFCAAVIFSALVIGTYCYSPLDDFAEMGYFLSREYLMIMHQTPYYEFPFYYGPAIVCLPYYLYRAAHGLLSIEQAYCTVLVLNFIAGFYALFLCVRLLFPAARQVAVFWVFALIFFNPMLGLQYTPLRYVLPVAAFLFCHNAVSKLPPDRFRSHLLVSLCAFLGPFLNFEISAEMGVAVTLALLIYFIALLRTPRRVYAYAVVMILAGALVAVLPWGNAYLGILFNFGDGFNLPLLPGPGILLFIAAAFILLPRLALFGVASGQLGAPASIGFCVLSGLLITPALGRCDMGHIYFNGFAIFLFAVAVLARLPDQRWFNRGLPVLLAIFLIASWPIVFHYNYSFKNAYAAHSWMRSHPGLECPPPSNGFVLSKPYPPMVGLEPLLKYGKLGIPLGCSQPVERFLMLHDRFATAYYFGNIGDEIFGPKQAARAVQDVDSYQTILVAKSFLDPSFLRVVPPDADELRRDSHYVISTELFPAKLVARHLVYSPPQLMAARVVRDFSVIGEFQQYAIMAKRPGVE